MGLFFNRRKNRRQAQDDHYDDIYEEYYGHRPDHSLSDTDILELELLLDDDLEDDEEFG